MEDQVILYAWHVSIMLTLCKIFLANHTNYYLNETVNDCAQ